MGAQGEDLSAQVATLQREIAAKEAQIQRLEAALNIRAAIQGSVLPLSDQLQLPRRASVATPSSSLSSDRGRAIAQLICLVKQRSTYCTVLPTGSMRPIFDEHSILLLEKAPFDSLKVGDIVTYRHPQLGVPVVHRLVEKDGDRFWSKGDANGRMDNVYVTRENYLERVYGVIYTAGP